MAEIQPSGGDECFFEAPISGMRGDILILTCFELRGKAFFRFLFMLLKTGVTILPSSRLARRYGGFCARVNGNVKLSYFRNNYTVIY